MAATSGHGSANAKNVKVKASASPTPSSATSADIREKLNLWESSLAVLNDKQKDSFRNLSLVATDRPLPKNLPQEVTVASDARRRRSAAIGKNAKHTELEGSISSQVEGGRIETFHHLHKWLDKVDTEIEEEEVKTYRSFIDQLVDYSEKCDALLEVIQNALNFLKEMKVKHAFVSTKTDALHQACQKLMDDQTKLMRVADGIADKLQYFNNCDKIGQKMSSPALSVTSESFLPILKKLDECITFMQENPQCKESQVYLARFQQFQSRALNLIRGHVTQVFLTTTQSLQQPAVAVTPEQAPGEEVWDSTYSLYYGKFRSGAPKVKLIVKELEQRSNKLPEYKLMMEDCHQFYLSQRSQLVVPNVNTNFQYLQKKFTHNLCGLVRASCSYMCRVCLDEYQLFHCFFTDKSVKLKSFLESISYNVYDLLRPFIIKVIHLETLAELCTILKVEIMEDNVMARKEELEACVPIFENLLEDIQQRLVYRAQKFIQSDIGGYSHSSGDLAYPEKLLMAREASAQFVRNESDSVFETSANESDTDVVTSKAGVTPEKATPTERVPPTAPADHHAMWYPTVRRSLLCLSKLYRCVEKSTFEGLAQDALTECVKSLEIASGMISTRKGKVDGHLFLIKHLLILREQIAPFDVNFTVRETQLDFSKTKAAARDLLKHRSRFFSLGSNNAFLEFFLHGAPELMEHYIDSKKDVDLKLKAVCEEFITNVTNLLSSPLKKFLEKVEVISQMAAKEGKDARALLRQQPFAEPTAIHDVVAEINKLLKSHSPNVLSSMALYLANEDTEYILFKPIKTSILQHFETLKQLVEENYNEEDSQIIACPLLEQVSIQLSRQANL